MDEMDNIIRDRVNDILRQRMALGLGGAMKKKRSGSKSAKKRSGSKMSKKRSGSKMSKKRSGSKTLKRKSSSKRKPCKSKKYSRVKTYKRHCKGSKSSKKACPVKGYRRCKAAGEGYMDDMDDMDVYYGRGVMVGGKGKSKKSKKAARNSPWIQHVKDYAYQRGLTYRDAMCKAGPSYRKMYGLRKKKYVGRCSFVNKKENYDRYLKRGLNLRR
jgi:hypothetical protein